MSYVETALKKEISIESIVTIHYFEYMKNFVFRGESHDFWEFLYVDQGKVLVQAGEKNHILEQGNVIFHQPNEFHAIKSIGQVAPNLIAVSFHCHSPAMQELIEKHFFLAPNERAIVSEIIKNAKLAFSTPLHIPTIEHVQLRPNAPFGSQQQIQLYIELFLLKAIQNHCRFDSGEDKTGNRAVSVAREDIYHAIIHYMDQHICEPMTVSQICNSFSLSKSTLQNIFHTRHKCGAIEYFNEQKIAYAKKMIRNGNKNICEISNYLSFSSPAYFSRCFKKVTGMSPKKYCSSVKDLI